MIDSTGASYAVNISDSVKTIGDVLDAISTTTNGKVTGKLNATGDGFELIDQAGGSQQLQVKELGGTTASDQAPSPSRRKARIQPKEARKQAMAPYQSALAEE